MEVVMGIKPQMPQTIRAGLPVRDIGVDDYVKQLIQSLNSTWKAVQDYGREVAAKREGTEKGSGGPELREGDTVLRVTTSDNRPRGSERFENRYDGEIYRVKRALGAKTFTIEKLSGEPVKDDLGNDKKISGEELVKCVLPELDLGLDPEQPKRLEVQDARDPTTWRKATLDGITADGKVFLRYDERKHHRVHLDLTKLSYRWLAESALEAGEGGSQGAPFSLLNNA